LVLNSVIREFKPRKIIEIGSGLSTCVMLDTNENWCGNRIQIDCIEPYPDRLRANIRNIENHFCIQQNFVQDISLENFVNFIIQDVMNNENALEEEVVEALNNLTQGIGQLVVRADKSLLQNLYDMVNGLDTSKYIATTVEGLTAPMAEALTVLENADATQEEVDAAYEALMRAYLNLRLKPSKDLLQDLINKANGLNRANYSAASLKLVDVEVEKATAVLNNPKASQEEVETAVVELTKVLAGLEVNSGSKVDTSTLVKPGDKTVSVKTGDTTNMMYSLGGLAVASIIFYGNKKRKNK